MALFPLLLSQNVLRDGVGVGALWGSQLRVLGSREGRMPGHWASGLPVPSLWGWQEGPDPRPGAEAAFSVTDTSKEGLLQGQRAPTSRGLASASD